MAMGDGYWKEEDAMPVATTGGTPATRWLMNRVSTNGLFVALFFEIGVIQTSH